MKPSVVGGGIGAVLGAIVAAQAHVISRTLPGSITLPRPYTQYESSRTLPPVPEVHSSWWPVLPIAVAVGLILGVLAAPLCVRFRVERFRIRAWQAAGFGMLIGAAVAVLAHFLAHALPSTYYTGFSGSEDSQTLQITGPNYSVRPPWLWSLPISVAVGLLLGLAAVAVLRTRARRRSGTGSLATV